ncbi:MAG: hypothetical protein QOJ39_3156 [Candidatus Eremiobacteraeota bacterium]|jgi:hypothetical protein|nr:hypothetical protein [Candidatus Eremiobacteraeota bacterium]MEA2721292.1 hypothetical protein [Candidatus Eremiobacteraeota bacterium]
MRKLAAIAMIAFAASISAFAAPATAMPGHNMMMGPGMKHRCPPGHHWVKGYHKKNGQKVKGYCR